MPADEIQALEAATPTEPEQAQQTAVVDQPTVTDQTAEPTDTTQQDKPKNDWVQRRIDQLTREKHEEKRQREALEAQLRTYQQPSEQGKPQTPTDIDAAVEARLKQREFDSACNKVFDAGKTEYAADWDSSLKTFQMLGGATPEFLEAVTSMDNGHKVLHYLGQNPEEAEKLLSLPPLRMALKLASLEGKVSAVKPPPTSKAPDPINPIGGKSAPVEPDEFGSTGEYIAWRKKNRK
jgi:hypothetical protein